MLSLEVSELLEDEFCDLSAENRSCMSLCMACIGFSVELVLDVALVESVDESLSLGGGGIWPFCPVMEIPAWDRACMTACMKSSPPSLRLPLLCTALVSVLELVLLVLLRLLR